MKGRVVILSSYLLLTIILLIVVLSKNVKSTNNDLTLNTKIPKEVFSEVEREADEYFKDDEMKDKLGFCHIYWGYVKDALRERGYDWKTPAEEHPEIIFD